MDVVRPSVDGIVLPKVESAADLRTVDWFITNLERERGLPLGGIDLMPIMETATGFSRLERIFAKHRAGRHVLVAQRGLDADLRQLLLHRFAEALPLLAVGDDVVDHLEADAIGLAREASLVEQLVRHLDRVGHAVIAHVGRIQPGRLESTLQSCCWECLSELLHYSILPCTMK